MSVQDIYQQRKNSLGNQPLDFQTSIAVRKSFQTLTDQERDDYINGVLILKNENLPENIYDQFVSMHIQAMIEYDKVPNYPKISAAHKGPAFLPWHRRFLFEFELQMANALGKPDYALPYWDWYSEADTISNSNIWGRNFLGGSGMPVPNGQFSPYTQHGTAPNQWLWGVHPFLNTPALVRQFQVPSTIPHLGNLDWIMSNEADYDNTNVPNSNKIGFRPDLEANIHNLFHDWVGGQMTKGFSPDDPLFFLHHCFLDKLWAEWQWRHSFYSRHNYSTNADLPAGHSLNAPLYINQTTKWNKDNNITGMQPVSDQMPNLSDWMHHENLGYRYDVEMNWQRSVQLKSSTNDGKLVFLDQNNNIYFTILPRVFNGSFTFYLRPGLVYIDSSGNKFIRSSPKNKYVMINNSTDPSDYTQGTYLTSKGIQEAMSSISFGNLQAWNNPLQTIDNQLFELSPPLVNAGADYAVSFGSVVEGSINYIEGSENTLWVIGVGVDDPSFETFYIKPDSL